jgi:hypothetical protein
MIAAAVPDWARAWSSAALARSRWDFKVAMRSGGCRRVRRCRPRPLQSVFGVTEFALQIEQPAVGRLGFGGLPLDQRLQKVSDPAGRQDALLEVGQNDLVQRRCWNVPALADGLTLPLAPRAGHRRRGVLAAVTGPSHAVRPLPGRIASVGEDVYRSSHGRRRLQGFLGPSLSCCLLAK